LARNGAGVTGTPAAIGEQPTPRRARETIRNLAGFGFALGGAVRRGRRGLGGGLRLCWLRWLGLSARLALSLALGFLFLFLRLGVVAGEIIDGAAIPMGRIGRVRNRRARPQGKQQAKRARGG
jgi:hypothetical protein